MKVCVVGTGNTGSAHAAILSRAGHEITALKTTRADMEHFEALERCGGLTLRDRDGSEAFVPIARVTRDPAEALRDPIDVLLVLQQTSGLEQTAKLVGSALRRAELTIVAPGYLGSVYFRRELGDRSPIVAEGESPAYDARIDEPGVVRVCFKNVRNALGFISPDKTETGLKIAGRLIDTYRYRRANVVDAALHNPNLVLHTLGCVTSASRIEYSRGEFWMYREGFTPSVWRALERLDEERRAVVAAYGGTPTRYLEDCVFRNAVDRHADPSATFESYAQSGGPKGPATLETRYLTEDVPVGLGLLRSLGAARGIPTPVADAVTTLTGALLPKEIMSPLRTLESLGLGDASDDALKKLGIL